MMKFFLYSFLFHDLKNNVKHFLLILNLLGINFFVFFFIITVGHSLIQKSCSESSLVF